MKVKLFAVCSAMLLVACGPRYQDRLADQNLNATLFVQQSGEYRALSYQAFNIAKRNFIESDMKKKAVVVDIDQTVLDISLHSGYLVREKRSFDKVAWSRFVDSKSSVATPGAVEFVNFVNSHDGRVFYVSNRTENEKVSTIENLRELGFSGVYDSTVLMRGNSSKKEERFSKIKGMGYNIVLFVGDNLNDFSDAPHGQLNQVRREFVYNNRGDFGTRFVILPNPTYGDYESGYAKDYNIKSDKDKVKIKERLLRPWDGK